VHHLLLLTGVVSALFCCSHALWGLWNHGVEPQVLHVGALLLQVQQRQPCCYCLVADACCSMFEV
jgi:hypothetical protein